jgi:hypothetical protein
MVGTAKMFRYTDSMQQIYFSYLFNSFEKRITQLPFDEWLKCKYLYTNNKEWDVSWFYSVLPRKYIATTSF